MTPTREKILKGARLRNTAFVVETFVESMAQMQRGLLTAGNCLFQILPVDLVLSLDFLNGCSVRGGAPCRQPYAGRHGAEAVNVVERATFMCILVNAETTTCGSAIQRLCNVSADDSLTR